VFLSLKSSAEMIFHARLQLGWKAMMEVVSSTVFLCMVIGGVLAVERVGGVLWAWVAATGSAAFFGWMVLLRYEKIDWTIRTDLTRKLFGEILPTGALLLLFSVYNKVDVLILEHFKGDAAVGIYGLAYKAYDNLVIGAAFLMNSVFPGMASDFARGDRMSVVKRFKGLFKVLVAGGVVLAGGVIVFAPFVIEILGGKEFMPAVIPLRWLSMATVFSYLNHLTGYSLIAFGKQRVSLMIAVGALIFNILLNWWLIPLYSYEAAAVVTGLTEAVVFMFSMLSIVYFFKSHTEE